MRQPVIEGSRRSRLHWELRGYGFILVKLDETFQEHNLAGQEGYRFVESRMVRDALCRTESVSKLT